MDLFDRIFSLHRILSTARHPVPRKVMEERLECSRATVKRAIENLRDRLMAPLVYDRARNGYHYDQDGEHPYELPGLWFNGSELYALLSTQHLLAETQPGLLEDHIAPLRQRIETILSHKHLSKGNIAQRVRLLSMAARSTPPEHFATVADTVMQRRRLAIVYHGRERDTVTERTVSPQRLVHYRDNWYLDAWCHTRRGLRSFAMDRIRGAAKQPAAARDVPEEKLHRHFTSAYGIFAGVPKYTAVLRFVPERARWVADERWHRDQQGRFLKDGRYELRVPYSDLRELVMDILKFGPDVEVISPARLRNEVRKRLAAALGRYEAD